MKPVLFSCLILFSVVLTARAQEPNIQCLLPTKDGFVGISGNGQVWTSPDGRTFTPRAQVSGVLPNAVLAGERLVITTSDGLFVVSLDGSWSVQKAAIKEEILDLEAGNGTVVVLTDKSLWHLGADGKWTSHPVKFRERIWHLAFANGVWVAGGAGAAGRSDTALYWSADGVNWQPAKIERPKGAEDEVDMSRGLNSLVGGARGFLALPELGSGLFSADGKTWRAVELPGSVSDSHAQFVAGRYWLIEYAQSYPNRFILRSSADLKTWTSVEAAPDVSIESLVEKDGQAWAFGGPAGQLRLLTAADKIDTLKSLPPPVTVAKAEPPSPAAPLAAPPPAASAPAPAPPVTVSAGSAPTPPTPEQIRSNKVAAIAAAFEEFENAIHAAEPKAFPKIAGNLVKTLLANADAHEKMPALIDAVSKAAGAMVENYCGAAGYYDLVMEAFIKGRPANQQPLLERLDSEKRKQFQQYASEMLDSINAALSGMKGYPSPEPPDWPVMARGERGPEKHKSLDVSAARRRLADGLLGSSHDLDVAWNNGVSTPKDPALASFYGGIGFAAGLRGQNFQHSDEQLQKMSDAGSAYAAAMLAHRNQKKAEQLTAPANATAEQLAQIEQQRRALYQSAHSLYTRAAEAGNFEAAVALGLLLLEPKAGMMDRNAAERWLEYAARAGHKIAQEQLAARFPQNSFALEWTKQDAETRWKTALVKAHKELSDPEKAKTSTNPVAKSTAEAMDAGRRLVSRQVLQQSFDSFLKTFAETSDWLAVAKAAGGFFKRNEDNQAHRAFLETFFEVVTLAVANHAGVDGFRAYHAELPASLAQKAVSFLTDHQSQIWTQAEAQPAGTPMPPEWKTFSPGPPRQPTRPAQQDHLMDRAKVRQQILDGDAAAALDHGYEYATGCGVRQDPDLARILLQWAKKRDPKLASLPDDAAKIFDTSLDTLIAAGSAHARYRRAQSLMPPGTKTVPAGEARSLLVEAAQRGHLDAAIMLGAPGVLKAEGKTDRRFVDNLDKRDASAPEVVVPPAVLAKVTAAKDAPVITLPPDQAKRINQLFEEFDLEYATATNRSTHALALSKLVNRLDREVAPESSALFAAAAAQHILNKGGFSATAVYLLTLPPKLQQAGRTALPADAQTAFENALPALALDQFDDPRVREAEQAWKPTTRPSAKFKAEANPKKGLDILRQRLAQGDWAAAADLGIAHRKLFSDRTDADLAAFYEQIARTAIPALKTAGDFDSPEVRVLLAEQGSAVAITDLADEVLKTPKSDIDEKQATALLAYADARGDSRASEKLLVQQGFIPPLPELNVRTTSWKDEYEQSFAESRMRQAVEYLRKGDLRSAVDEVNNGLSRWDQVPSLRKPHVGLLLTRARIYATAGDLAKADADLTAILRAKPDHADALGLRARMLLAQRQVDQARATAESALQHNPLQGDALLTLAQLDLHEQKPAAAQDKLLRAILANPQSDDARVLYGIALGRVGQLDRAVAVWEIACQRNPYNLGARERLIIYYARESKKPDDAWRHVRELETLNHPRAADYRTQLQKLLETHPPPTGPTPDR